MFRVGLGRDLSDLSPRRLYKFLVQLDALFPDLTQMASKASHMIICFNPNCAEQGCRACFAHLELVCFLTSGLAQDDSNPSFEVEVTR